ASNHNSVPMILGTNRDEPSVFMFADPRHVEVTDAGRRLRDEGAYLREVKYGALAWKERGVDSLAILLTASGNENVFGYRFDWDEEGMVGGMDYSKMLGAAHAVELPFVFGDFTTGWVLEDIFSNSAEKDVLADNMMSYWTEFARTGNPGKGRSGELPEWTAWDTDGETMLILDTPSDQGIHMTSGALTPAGMKAALVADPGIVDRVERCARYAQMFLDGPHFDPVEFAALGRAEGQEGCAGLDPRELRGF
ncbi:MAG: carboxylesterase family protein, partial [Gammaproteobacteria bacterium]|nr:carboxylesterase family protein [Gammaproteobacteria bacterium]